MGSMINFTLYYFASLMRSTWNGGKTLSFFFECLDTFKDNELMIIARLRTAPFESPLDEPLPSFT